LRSQISLRGRKAGLTHLRCSPHTFRHSFAVNYLRCGGDAFSLKRILGHNSMATVNRYVNLSQVDIQQAHRKYSPLDNL
jgi:integrase/recombinase XerD